MRSVAEWHSVRSRPNAKRQWSRDARTNVADAVGVAPAVAVNVAAKAVLKAPGKVNVRNRHHVVVVDSPEAMGAPVKVDNAAVQVVDRGKVVVPRADVAASQVVVPADAMVAEAVAVVDQRNQKFMK